MAILHMDVEAVNSVVNSINSSKETLSNTLLVINSEIQGLVGTSWISPSANQFQSSYFEWATMMRNMVEQLETLNQRLRAEIDEFEQAASTL